MQGFRMDECDYDGRTALHLAAAEGHLVNQNSFCIKLNEVEDLTRTWDRFLKKEEPFKEQLFYLLELC
jgi:hypothetical protein